MGVYIEMTHVPFDAVNLNKQAANTAQEHHIILAPQLPLKAGVFGHMCRSPFFYWIKAI